MHERIFNWLLEVLACQLILFLRLTGYFEGFWIKEFTDLIWTLWKIFQSKIRVFERVYSSRYYPHLILIHSKVFYAICGFDNLIAVFIELMEGAVL